jgi:hypothetical protein
MTSHEALDHCIGKCQECARVCLETLTYCLGRGGTYVEADHLRTLLDCVDICEVSARFLLRTSPHHELTCAACAKVCTRCAESCVQFVADDTMKRCAEVCRLCASSCVTMSAPRSQVVVG